jgi:predicted phage terminase large subunit-like protein
MVRVCRRWDLAFSERDGADFVAGAKMGMGEDGRIYILHIKRLRGRWTQTKAQIVQTSQDDGQDVVVLIEANGTQLGYFQDVKSDPLMRSRLVLPDKPEGNKEMRASVWGSRLQDGVIRILRGEWSAAFVDEMDAFPNGEHDDQVDAVSGGYAYLISNANGKVEYAPGIW